jgi:hypothetical protein
MSPSESKGDVTRFAVDSETDAGFFIRFLDATTLSKTSAASNG